MKKRLIGIFAVALFALSMGNAGASVVDPDCIIINGKWVCG
jgi:hypothetical protein